MTEETVVQDEDREERRKRILEEIIDERDKPKLSPVDQAAKANHEKWMAEQKDADVEHVYHPRNGEDLMQDYELLSDMAQADIRARVAEEAAHPPVKKSEPEQVSEEQR